MSSQENAPTAGHNAVNAGHLRSFVERIERLEEELTALQQDRKEVYAEAKFTGFDPKIIRMVVRERKREKAEREEQLTLFDLYWRAVNG